MSQSIASRNACLDAANALLNGGTVEIRTGAAAAIDSAPTGTILATLTIPATAFTTASAGSATANTIATVAASATGTAGHYVAKNSGGTATRNGTIGAEMTVSSTSVVSGENFQITSWSASQAA